MSDPKLCKWHKCSNTFIPEHANRMYCSSECRKRRLDWAKAYGSVLVNTLLNTPPEKRIAVFLQEQKALDKAVERKPVSEDRDISD